MRRLVGIVQSVTPARLLTLAGVYFGFGLSILFRRSIVLTGPSFLTVEPVCGCNLQCPECPVGSNELVRPKGQISMDIVDLVIESFGRRAIWVNLYFQGEPLLHPQFPEIVARFSAAGLFTSVSTNGLLLTSPMVDKLMVAGIKEIIFSVDGSSESEYLVYRKGGSFQKAIENIQLVVAKRKAFGGLFPRIVYQSLITSANEDSLKNIRRFAISLGVDAVELKTINLHHGEDIHNLLPSKSKFSRYGKIGKRRNRYSCLRLWSNAVISIEGRLALCCMDKEVNQLGETNSQSLSTAWNSNTLNRIRAHDAVGRNLPVLCNSCSLQHG